MIKVVVAIAGSDSSGGAGIQADVKTLDAHGLYGVMAVTAITAQNTTGVRDVFPLPAHVVRSQLQALVDDFDIAAVKIGMLATAPIVETVATFLGEQRPGLPIVCDPVFCSTTGSALLTTEGVARFRDAIVPLATLITPNVSEARSLLTTESSALNREEIARALVRGGARSVLVTGGDEPVGDEVVDVFVQGRDVHRFSSKYLRTPHTHGTGCTLSTAIAANLAGGYSLIESIGRARDYVYNAIRRAPGIGRGHGPLMHRLPGDQ